MSAPCFRLANISPREGQFRDSSAAGRLPRIGQSSRPHHRLSRTSGDGHIERAMLIARAALPADMRKPDRPIWNGACVPIANATRGRGIAREVLPTATQTGSVAPPSARTGRASSPLQATTHRGSGMPPAAPCLLGKLQLRVPLTILPIDIIGYNLLILELRLYLAR